MDGKHKTNTKGWKNTSFEIPEELELTPKEIRNFILFAVECFGLFKGTKQSDQYIENHPQFDRYFDAFDKKIVKDKLRERVQ